MKANAVAVKAGWRRGLTELRQSFTNGPELFSHFLWPVLMLGALFFLQRIGTSARPVSCSARWRCRASSG